MERIITAVKSKPRLFKQPFKIGDVIEIRDKSYLILGIERFILHGHELTIWFTCQDLTKTDFLSMNKAYKQQHTVEAFVKAKQDNERLRLYELGTVHYIDGQAYKIQEYTEILIKGTDIEISFTVHPIDRKEAKAKLISERWKKLQ
ncbi:hypothetical protein [uncultured Brevibacillus sp.]|uniref:hypothetical protein n=1 Tax=uncultured Brevibacillus sp. TaxID=169970 RepID=UPI00259A92B2|nr:hypothetical protein [uncultured Brevibacillus sp.]